MEYNKVKKFIKGRLRIRSALGEAKIDFVHCIDLQNILPLFSEMEDYMHCRRFLNDSSRGCNPNAIGLCIKNHKNEVFINYELLIEIFEDLEKEVRNSA